MNSIAIPDSQPLAMMTAGDLRDLIEDEWNRRIESLRRSIEKPAQAESKEPVYIVGLQAMADHLQMSLKTFQRNRQRGMFDGIIHQMGRQYRAKAAELDAAWDRCN